MVRETELAERQLKRTLGPVSLSALGIGAIIGAGIFSTAGTAAAGGAGHLGAGPALVLSFLMVAVGIIRLRQTRPDWPRPFRVLVYPWIPLGAVLTSGYLMVELPRIPWIRFIV